jgi:hypothetical protein
MIHGDLLLPAMRTLLAERFELFYITHFVRDCLKNTKINAICHKTLLVLSDVPPEGGLSALQGVATRCHTFLNKIVNHAKTKEIKLSFEDVIRVAKTYTTLAAKPEL